jgi:BMFP domain-containing protein YqiC
MEKYNKFLGNIRELVEKGLFNSKEMKNELENLLKFKVEAFANKLNFVTREEFEVQKKIVENLEKKVNKSKTKKKKKKL